MAKSTDRTARRANGEGSLRYDDKRDRWRGAVAWTDRDGRLQRKAFAGKTRSSVKARMDAFRAEVEAGRQSTSTLTVTAYLGQWLEAERARVRPSTLRYREGHVRLYIVPELGSLAVADVTPRDVERLTTKMVDEGRSPRTAAGCRTTLRKALGDALRDGHVHRNVAALARPPRIPGREVDYLDRDELRKLLAACEADPAGPIVELAALTGLRQGELLGLVWSDIDVAGGTLTVRRSMARAADGGFELAEPKTSRSRRTVHLPDQALAALERRREAQDADREAARTDWQDVDGLVFTDELGRPLPNWTANREFHRLLEAADVRSVPFHALRHSWATLALASGVPIKVVADNLGHASISVTAAFYSGIVPELGRDAAVAVGRALE